MSDGYTKLFGSILDSTVWQEDGPTRLVWIAMLAMASRVGVVDASVPGLAARARVTIPECEAALAKFMAPDAYSRTPDHDGRRIAPTGGGWCLLNHPKYRLRMSAEDRREKDAERKRQTRADACGRMRTDADSPDASEKVRDVSHAEAEAEADPKAEAGPDRERPRKRGARAKPRALISESFFPDLAGLDLARVAGWTNQRVEAERQKFINTHLAKGTLFANPQAGWRTWVGRSPDFERPSGTHPTTPDRSSQSSPAFQRQLERIRKAEAEEKEAS